VTFSAYETGLRIELARRSDPAPRISRWSGSLRTGYHPRLPRARRRPAYHQELVYKAELTRVPMNDS